MCLGSFMIDLHQILLTQAFLCIITAWEHTITFSATLLKQGSCKGPDFLQSKTQPCQAPHYTLWPPRLHPGLDSGLPSLHSEMLLLLQDPRHWCPGNKCWRRDTASSRWLQPALSHCTALSNLQGNQSRLAVAQLKEAGGKKDFC